jgi:hypothetical protein
VCSWWIVSKLSIISDAHCGRAVEDEMIISAVFVSRYFVYGVRSALTVLATHYPHDYYPLAKEVSMPRPTSHYQIPLAHSWVMSDSLQ